MTRQRGRSRGQSPPRLPAGCAARSYLTSLVPVRTRICDVIGAGGIVCELCDRHILKTKRAEVLKSLQGTWQDHHLFALRLALEDYKFCQARAVACDRKIQQLLEKINQDQPPINPPAEPNRWKIFLFPINGLASPDGQVIIRVAKRGLPVVEIQLGFDATNAGSSVSNQITVADQPLASFTAERVPYDKSENPANMAGRCTMLMPDSSSGVNGYATVNITTAGAVQLSGAMPDGRAWTHSTTISGDGRFPMFAAFPGAGPAVGYLAFANQPSVRFQWHLELVPRGDLSRRRSVGGRLGLDRGGKTARFGKHRHD